MRLLIIYGTIEGQTRKICRFLKEEAEKLGHTADLAEATDEPYSPENHDAAILASSVHMSGYNSALLQYAHQNAGMLNKMPSAFVSVSLTAAFTENQDPESWDELQEITERFFEESHWKPQLVEYAAGALRYTHYSWFKKFIMRQIAKQTHHETNSSQDYEYTDYNQLRSFLKEFLEEAGKK